MSKALNVISSVMKGVMKAVSDGLTKATAKWLIHKNIPPTPRDSPISKQLLVLTPKLGGVYRRPLFMMWVLNISKKNIKKQRHGWRPLGPCGNRMELPLCVIGGPAAHKHN